MGRGIFLASKGISLAVSVAALIGTNGWGLTMTQLGVFSDQQIYQIGAYLETLAKDGANWKEPAK